MSNKSHCSHCGSDADPLVIRRGSVRTQVILWFMLVLPGFFYSMWRESTKRTVCSVCGSEDVAAVCPLEEKHRFAQHH